MRSLRVRLMIGTGVATALLGGSASVTLYFLVRSVLYAEFDQLLAAKARALATLVEEDQGEVEVEFAEHPLDEFERAERPEYFQLWLDDGRVLARSRHLERHNLERVGGEAANPEFRFVRLPDGRAGRVAGISFYPSSSGRVTAETPGRVTLALARDSRNGSDTRPADLDISGCRLRDDAPEPDRSCMGHPSWSQTGCAVWRKPLTRSTRINWMPV